MISYPDHLLEALQKLHELVDKSVSELEKTHAGRINCRKGCFSCCKDDLEVFGIEAEWIRRNKKDLLQNEEPHPPGKCAFLDEEGACRIYAYRPFVCRTHGVPIRYLQEDDQGPYELRDICPLNEEGEPLETLPEERIFNNMFWEEQLAMLQLAADKGKLDREKLRGLFLK